MDEVTHIWAEYGVDIEALKPRDAVRDDAVRLTVVLANLPNVPTAPGMLGSIPFLDDSPEPVIILYPSAIATLVSGVKVSALPDHDWIKPGREVAVELGAQPLGSLEAAAAAEVPPEHQQRRSPVPELRQSPWPTG